ncbi:TonB-dependent receptor [Stutzerimonas azotifigens]|uniref:TonB-dependent siderophore receptor n=1 Tax=Stutzerimonas azotifigens TaxID=291995 RepID=A0ABR5Z6C5_9GAMM|nr:TonB-dependent siderophore receptor [Stutzerimonas azotifigens]MBA1275688.1 TonB-dependent siderophore receptor [Stutzerimonas azotifigens]
MSRISSSATKRLALVGGFALTVLPPGAIAEDDDDPSTLTLPPMAVIHEGHRGESPSAPARTGSRLDLPARQIPASTSTLDEHAISQRNNLSVQDAVTRIPGITSIANPGNGNTALSARGFTGHTSVMTLFDGNRLYTGAGTQTFPVDPWMVERIEVIRGPASVLYGEGATGAAVSIVPKKPFEGEILNRIRVGYGSDDHQQQALDSGGSLSETLSYRLTLNRQASNGWVDRGDSQSHALSAALRWQPSDDLNVTLAHERGDSEPARYFGTPLIGGHLLSSLEENNYNIRDAVQHYRDEWTRLDTDWNLSEAISASNQLYFIKSRRHWRNAEAYRWDDSRGQLLRGDYLEIRHNQEQLGARQSFTMEHSLFGLSSKTVVGTEYNRIRFGADNNAPYTDVGGDYIDPWNPADGYFQSASPYGPNNRSRTRTFALFAENATRLSERWTLVSGVRRDQNHIDRDDERAGTRSGRSLSGGNWRAGLVFALTDELSLYGQYATSQDGINNLISLTPSQQQMALTRARQAEFGLKQSFWQSRGQWTLAAFQITKKRLLSQTAANEPTQQIGQQSSEGLEASLELAMARGWHLSANASLLRAEYDDFSEAVGGALISRDGNTPVGVPRRTANLWVSKRIGADLDAGLGLRYVDKRYADTANIGSLPGYTVLDANLEWAATRDIRIGLEAYNLLDRRYARTYYGSAEQWLLGQPRSFLVTADYRF